MRVSDDHLYLPTGDGQFISEKQRRIAEIIKDYHRHLSIEWIPVNKRGPDDYAFRVIDRTPGRAPYIVTFAKECDERLLAKIIQRDSQHHNVLDYLDNLNNAIELYEEKKRKEERMEMYDFAYTVLHSRKEHFKHKGYNFGAFNGGR